MVGWLWNSALLTQCVPFWKDCELAPLCKNTKNTYWPTRISWDGIGLLFLGCLWRSCIDVCIYWGVSSSVHVSNSLFTITCVQLLTFALVNPFISILVCMFLWVYSYNRASTLDYISIYICKYTCIYMYHHISMSLNVFIYMNIATECLSGCVLPQVLGHHWAAHQWAAEDVWLLEAGYDVGHGIWSVFFSRFWPSNSGE